MLYLNILPEPQQEFLNKLQKLKGFFNKNHIYLAGGTALALHLGHRISIDFDFFVHSAELQSKMILTITNLFHPQNILINTKEQLTFIVNNVNITFLAYPFLLTTQRYQEIPFELADIHSIASTKAYALGKRAKWKDYVDLYIYLNLFSIKTLLKNSTKIYGTLFVEKLFREQLCYFEDIDFTEKVIWTKTPEELTSQLKIKEYPPRQQTIKIYLCKIAKS